MAIPVGHEMARELNNS
jgi:hypothetical protein